MVIGNGKAYKIKCLRYIAKHNLSNRVAFLSGIYAITIIVQKILNPSMAIGYASIFVAIIFLL